MLRCAGQLSRGLPPPAPLLPSASLLPPLARDCVDRLWNRRNASRVELYRLSRFGRVSSSSAAWPCPGPVATFGAARTRSSLLLALPLTRSARAIGAVVRGVDVAKVVDVAEVVVSAGVYVSRMGSRGVLGSYPPLVGSAWSDLRFLKNLNEGILNAHRTAIPPNADFTNGPPLSRLGVTAMHYARP